MKKLLATLAVAATLSFGALAYAYDGADQDGTHQDWHHDSMFEKLPAADAQLIKDTLKKAHEDTKPLMKQAKQLHQDIRAILMADQFDEKAFIAKQDKMQALHNKIKSRMTAAFASALAQLSPDDRKMIADSMDVHQDWHHNHDVHADDKSTHDAK